MMNLVVMVATGVGLFAASLVGMLAVSDRLNHEGTKGIPVLSSFFPEEPKEEGEDGHGGEHDESAGEHGGSGDHAADSHGESDHADSHGHDSHGGNDHGGDHADSHGGDHGAHGDGHGDPSDGHGEHEGGVGTPTVRATGHSLRDLGSDSVKPVQFRDLTDGGNAEHSEEDADATARHIAEDGHAPGSLFVFEPISSGMQVSELNAIVDYVNRRQQELADEQASIRRERNRLEAMSKDLEVRREEIQTEMRRIYEMRDELTELFEQYQRMVREIPKSEEPQLRQAAESIAALEPDKAAELVLGLWAEDRDRALNILDHMSSEAVHAILNVMDSDDTRQLINARIERRAVRTDGAGR